MPGLKCSHEYDCSHESCNTMTTPFLSGVLGFAPVSHWPCEAIRHSVLAAQVPLTHFHHSPEKSLSPLSPAFRRLVRADSPEILVILDQQHSTFCSAVGQHWDQDHGSSSHQGSDLSMGSLLRPFRSLSATSHDYVPGGGSSQSHRPVVHVRILLGSVTAARDSVERP